MIALFVDQRTDAECYCGVADSEQVHCKRGDGGIEDYRAEILDVYEHGVEMENRLHRGGVYVDGIEDRGHIHKEHGKYAPEVLHVAEEYEKSRENKSDTEVEYDKAYDRYHKKKEEGCKGDSVDYAEEDEYDEGKSEINK